MKERKYLILLPIRIILFIILFSMIALITKNNLQDTSKYWTLGVVICNFITIAILFLFCKKNHTNYWDLIDYKKSKLKNIIIIGVIIALIDTLGTYIFSAFFPDTATYSTNIIMQPLPVWLVILDLILLPITSIFAEEGLYLGVGINKANNIYLAILFYSLQHCFFPMIFDFKYMIYRFIAFMPSIIFMCIYYKKKKEIVPIMFEHFIINFVTIIQILLISI